MMTKDQEEIGVSQEEKPTITKEQIKSLKKGLKDLSIEDSLTDDTAPTISREEIINLLPKLKEELHDDFLLLSSSSEVSNDDDFVVSDENLMKFLCWKHDVKRAADRYRAHIKWRKENTYAFDNPQQPLLLGKDPKLRHVIESNVIIAPDGLVDKKGNTVLIGRLRNNDMTDGRTVEDVVRMAMYTIDRILERDSTKLHGVTIFHDMIGLTKKNIDIGIPQRLFGAIIGHFPLRISGLYILNAPIFFRGIFSILSMIMPAKLRERTHFISSVEEIYDVIDQDELLVEHGGKRTHHASQWISDQIDRENNNTMISLYDCLPHNTNANSNEESNRNEKIENDDDDEMEA